MVLGCGGVALLSFDINVEGGDLRGRLVRQIQEKAVMKLVLQPRKGQGGDAGVDVLLDGSPLGLEKGSRGQDMVKQAAVQRTTERSQEAHECSLI